MGADIADKFVYFYKLTKKDKGDIIEKLSKREGAGEVRLQGKHRKRRNERGS